MFAVHFGHHYFFADPFRCYNLLVSTICRPVCVVAWRRSFVKSSLHIRVFSVQNYFADRASSLARLAFVVQPVTALENGEVVEMSASSFRTVRSWCRMYQAQWQTFNQMCLDPELGEFFKRAAAAGPDALFDYKEYGNCKSARWQSWRGESLGDEPYGEAGRHTPRRGAL